MMFFTVGVTSGHTLNRDIELSFSTADIDIGGIVAIIMMLIVAKHSLFLQLCLPLLDWTILQYLTDSLFSMEI